MRCAPSARAASANCSGGTCRKASTSAASFGQWHKDVPGVNMAAVVPLTMTRVAGTNRFVIDSATMEPWVTRGGFFPINGQLYGNYSSTGKNFHFTYQLDTTFTYIRGGGNLATMLAVTGGAQETRVVGGTGARGRTRARDRGRCVESADRRVELGRCRRDGLGDVLDLVLEDVGELHVYVLSRLSCIVCNC
mgnify:CR=1 FL=1